MGSSKSTSKREVYVIDSYIKKKGRLLINNLMLHLKEPEKRTKLKASRRKEITNTRANEIQIRKTIEKHNKTKR